MYRSDVLEAAGVEVPTTYEEMLAAETIREQGIWRTLWVGRMLVGTSHRNSITCSWALVAATLSQARLSQNVNTEAEDA